MGYMHIDNLYRDDRIFSFDECFALEKVHGTSAHITYKADQTDGTLVFFSGGASTEAFSTLFDKEKLMAFFQRLGAKEATIYGEAYGGKMQGMSATYGDELKFVVFDVKADGVWANVRDAHLWANLAGLEFVEYARISTKLADIDAERAKPSAQAIRNGIIEPKEREGIVLRPLEEAFDKRGNRIITKHKNDSFKETKTQREVDPTRLQVLSDANKIADEWVTEMRLSHVLQKIHPESVASLGIEDTSTVIRAMIEDVRREAKGEILESKEAMKAIGSATARLFKKRFTDRLKKNYE